MAWLRRAAVFIAVLAAAGAVLGGSGATPKAAAVSPCIGISPGTQVITGAIGIGNPVGDACEAVADAIPDPLGPIKDAASSIGKGVFEQITSWAAEGAIYLLGQVAELADRTTTPDLLSKGFLRQYRGMASIATVLALLMLVFAVLESLGRGDGGMLVRVFFVNVPLAAIATSAAYVVVQLMVATTDGFCEAITHATAHDTEAFFKSAIAGLSSAGGDAGKATGEAAGVPPSGEQAAGAVTVPLFVGFIAAMIAALAAFLVWIELLMRDAAIYAVALFMPMAIAASIWPRWMSALRRTGELLIVVVFSKFVIVSVIALAASLMANSGGDVEHVLAAGALLLLACFAPFVLFKLVPFAEGAVSAAYNRQGAGGAAVRTVEFASSVSMMRRAALANWAAGGAAGGRGGGGSSSSGGGASAGRRGGGGGAGGGEGGAGAAAGASGGAAGAVALPVAAGGEAAKTTEAAAGRLADSGTSQAAGQAGQPGGGGGGSGGSSTDGASGGGTGAGSERAKRPASDEQAAGVAGGGSGGGTAPTPEPTEAAGGSAPGSGTKPTRPAADAAKGGKPGAKS